jgi:hypothetical protein
VNRFKFRSMTGSRARGLGLVSVLGALAAAAPASAAILTNGDFEQPGGFVRSQISGPGDLPGWTYDSHGTGFEIYQDQAFDGLAAANGTHYVSFGHNGAHGGSLSQTFATVAGGTYMVAYSVAEQQGDDASQVLRAILTNGVQVLSQDNTGLTLSFLAGAPISFIALGNSATLTFLDATPAGGGGPSNLALDAVSVTGPQVGGGVPEPATWGLMLLGFGLTGATARSRRARSVLA